MAEQEPPLFTGELEHDRKAAAEFYDNSRHRSTLATLNTRWFPVHNYELDGHTVRGWIEALKHHKRLNFSPFGGRPLKVDSSIYLDTERKLDTEAKEARFVYALLMKLVDTTMDVGGCRRRQRAVQHLPACTRRDE
jgi:hypothetical protein